MKGLIWVIVIIILIIVLVLVFSGEEYNGEDRTTEEMAAVENARADLKLSGLISPDSEIETKNIQNKDWPDACLGIVEVGELCAQVITPGYEVTLEAEDTKFVYRTNEAGDFVVLAEQN